LGFLLEESPDQIAIDLPFRRYAAPKVGPHLDPLRPDERGVFVEFQIPKNARAIYVRFAATYSGLATAGVIRRDVARLDDARVQSAGHRVKRAPNSDDATTDDQHVEHFGAKRVQGAVARCLSHY
jgi:hypothetical protein